MNNAVKIESLLMEFFNNDIEKVNEWIFTSNRILGNQKPIDMIKIGRSKKLLDWIEIQLSENKPNKKQDSETHSQTCLEPSHSSLSVVD